MRIQAGPRQRVEHMTMKYGLRDRMVHHQVYALDK